MRRCQAATESHSESSLGIPRRRGFRDWPGLVPAQSARHVTCPRPLPLPPAFWQNTIPKGDRRNVSPQDGHDKELICIILIINDLTPQIGDSLFGRCATLTHCFPSSESSITNQREIICKSMTLKLREPVECGSEGVHGQMAGVDGGGRQPTDGAHQEFSVESSRLPDRVALNKLSECRSAGHGTYTAFGKEADLLNAVARKFEGELEDIATCWILNLHGRVGIGDEAGVAGMLEVVENLWGVHCVLCDGG